MRSSRCVSRAA